MGFVRLAPHAVQHTDGRALGFVFVFERIEVV
jgi:hypothetical protein